MYRRSKGGWGWGGVAVLVPHPCAQVLFSIRRSFTGCYQDILYT
jgi:hypothetical protein